jgi:hypothetical protein
MRSLICIQATIYKYGSIYEIDKYMCESKYPFLHVCIWAYYVTIEDANVPIQNYSPFLYSFYFVLFYFSQNYNLLYKWSNK